MTTLREALKKRAWWCSLRSSFPEAQDDAEADIERALRAAYNKGYELADLGLIQASDNGVTAGIAATVEES